MKQIFLKVSFCCLLLLFVVRFPLFGNSHLEQLTQLDTINQTIKISPKSDFNAITSWGGTPLALRSNLLLLVIGGPNIGIEIPLGNRFSTAVSLAYVQTRINNTYALQTKQITLEGRYWFNQKENALTGWNLGLYGTYCDRFDVQWKRGFQGDGYWSFGLGGGYSIPLSNRFNLDLSLAAGFLNSSEIREYSKPQDGHLIWEKTIYNANRFILTRACVNLVWLINKKSK